VRKETKKRDSAAVKFEPKLIRLKSKLSNKNDYENEELEVKKRNKSVKIEVPVALITIFKKRLIYKKK